ncbi:MAG: sialidase family protein [Thermoleophilaceae bacterium]
MRRIGIGAGLVTMVALALPAAPALGDAIVTTGSPQGINTFPENKQNEPGVALNLHDPSNVVAGANEEIDVAFCGALDPDGIANDCPFTFGVGTSGFYTSPTNTLGWTQPTYQGFTARGETTSPGGNGHFPGPIGTPPNYHENGLVSDGDPTLAFGPAPGPGGFSYDNGSRLYYSNLTANNATVRQEQTFKGFEAVAVSHTDNLGSAWSNPSVVTQTRQSSTTFSDKPTVWADNASDSKYFGRVYVCYAQFKSQQANGPAPIGFTYSTDGGISWARPQTLTQSANNKNGTGRQGCVVKSDSLGRVYVFYEGTKSGTSHQFLTRSTNGGRSFERPFAIAPVTDVGQPDPVTGDFVFDGNAGTRTDSFPSVDIANGAPTGGTSASNTIAVTWSDGTKNNEKAVVIYSNDRGDTWSDPDPVSAGGDRADFPAVALSPNGDHAFVVYDGFTENFKNDIEGSANDRPFQGVIRTGDPAQGSTWTTKYRGPTGDARASSANALDSEFIGDYNWIAATNSFAIGVFNDARNGDACAAIDHYRQQLIDGSTTAVAPAPNSCGNRFGNSDIYSEKVAP